MTSVISVAVFFLALGTFVSVSVQGAYLVLITVPMIYYAWLAKGRQFRLPASSWWLLAFAAVATLTILLNWSDIPKPTKNLGRMKYFLMGAFGIFATGVWLKHVSDRVKKRLLVTLSLAVLAGGVYCAYQVLIMGVAKPKPFTETMRYSYGSALMLVLMLSLFTQRELFMSWFTPKWATVGIVGLVLSTIFMQSRGAQLAIILAAPLVLIFWNKKWGIVALFVGGLLVGAVGANYLYGTQSKSTISLLKNKDNTSDQKRFSQWASAWLAFQERPILGWGFGNFHTQVKRIKEQYDLPAKQYNDAHAHNVPLEIAAGTGIVGLFFFLGWFLTWCWECWSAGGMVRAVMFPFLLALAFEAQFEVLLDANNATWISFLYAVSLACNKRYQLSFA